jgi:hypothetical protein
MVHHPFMGIKMVGNSKPIVFAGTVGIEDYGEEF